MTPSGPEEPSMAKEFPEVGCHHFLPLIIVIQYLDLAAHAN